MGRGKTSANINNNWDLTLIFSIEEFLVSSLLLKRGFRFYAEQYPWPRQS